jgi:predicted nucleic acid-binding protein
VIVLDASAVAEILLQSPRGVAIADEALASGEDLHAPHLIDAEVGSVLRRSRLRGVISELRAVQALTDLMDLPIQRHGHLPLLAGSWDRHRNLTFYDGLYVALADYLRAPLMTCDRRIADAPTTGVEILLR